MPYLYDRVRETTTTTGTGTVTLNGAVLGFQTFSNVLSNNDTCYYVISNSSGDWECGIGTYSSNTLERTTITSSSNSGSAVNFGSGTKNVFIDATASAFTNGSNITNAGLNIGLSLALSSALP